jgi:hypothetical protein
VLVDDSHEVVDRAGVGEVDPHAVGAAACVPDLLLDLHGTVNDPDEVEHHRGPLGRQPLHNRTADTSRSTRDHSALTVQHTHRHSHLQ